MHTHVHTRTCTHAHTRTGTHSHAHTHARTHTYTTHTHTPKHTCTHAYTHTCTHTYTDAHTRAHTWRHVHTHTRTHTHTHTGFYRISLSLSQLVSWSVESINSLCPFFQNDLLLLGLSLVPRITDLCALILPCSVGLPRFLVSAFLSFSTCCYLLYRVE